MKPRIIALAAISISAISTLAGHVGAEDVETALRTELQMVVGHAYQGVPGSGAIVREVRAVTLPPGRQTVAWKGLPETALPETLMVAVVGAGGARVVGHRVQESAYSVAGVSSMLQGTQAVAADMRRTRPPRPTQGTIVSLAEGTVLRVGNELTVLGPSSLKGGSLPARSLSIDVEVPAGGPSKIGIEVTALVGKIQQHMPRYTLRLDAGAGRGSLHGSLLVENLSGTSLDGARTMLARGSALSAHGDFGLGKVWTTAPLVGRPDPFPLADAIHFDPTLVAETTIIHADALAVTHAMVATPNVMSLFERDADPAERALPLTRVAAIDVAPVNLEVPLPNGEAVVFASSDPTAAPVILGKGKLVEGDRASASISMPEPTLRIEARQRSAQHPLTCRGTAVWVYTVPDRVVEVSRFDLVLEARKGALSAKIRGKSAATVITEPLRTIVRLPRRAPNAPRPSADGAQKIELEVRMAGCP